MELLRKGEAVETKQVEAALQYYQKAFAWSKKINYTKGYFETMRLMTYQLNNMGRHDEAQKLAAEAVQKAKQDTSKRNLGLSYFALANTALFRDRFQEAIPNYRKAAQYMQQIGSKRNVAVVYQNLGYIYSKQRMYPQAIDYYQRALAIDTTFTVEKADRRSIASDYFNIGVAFGSQGKKAQTMLYYRKARQWIEPENDLDFLINLYNNIGYEHSLEQRYDSALHYRQQALRFSRQLGNARHEIHLLMSMAQTRSQMGQYDQARKLLDQSNAIAIKTKAGLTELSNIYREYVVAHTGLNNYKEALNWMDKYMGIRDSISNEDTKLLLQEYELKIKQAEARQTVAEKQRQIARLENDKTQQTFWLWLAGILTVAVIGLSVFGYLYYRQRQRTADNALLAADRERKLAIVQSELQGQQKERLRISKEMHDDMGASLTAIGLLSEVVKTRMGTGITPEIEKISTISADMVTTMNEIIWSLNTRNDSLNGLIAYTRAYASEFIENTTLRLRTQVEESPHEIPVRGVDRRNVFLTVKEALNNVVKHAQATEVTLLIQPESNQLRIEVCDNGRGFTPNGRSHLRNGLTNMQNRMAESGGSCEISPSETGTCVSIRYPYAPVTAEKIMQM